MTPPPSPRLARRREWAHDLTCFSSFSCWNADRCSIFSRQTLDRQPNITRGINAKIPIGPSHLKDKEVDYWRCVLAQMSASGWRPMDLVMTVSHLKSLKSGTWAAISVPSAAGICRLTAKPQTRSFSSPGRLPKMGHDLQARPGAFRSRAAPSVPHVWWSSQLTAGLTTSQAKWQLENLVTTFHCCTNK